MKLTVFYKILNNNTISSILNKDENSLDISTLIEFAELESVTDDPLKEFVITKLADDENVLAKILGRGASIGDDLKNIAIADLNYVLSALNNLSAFSYIPSEHKAHFCNEYTRSIRAMVKAKTADELFELLCKHYKTLGTGIFARYTALLCSKDGLSGIENPDTTSFNELIGLEHIKKTLTDNTELFLSGKKANNVLLFGDRGTGKSSCVKALLNKYHEQGLRVIELPKNCITLIPDLYKELSSKPQKFILYLDDLSFEKHEPEYRSLKVSMEGQLGSIPQNVLIFATSNRRHLIKENWKDREGGDVHAGDNMQEMLSLSERFGISLVFSAPNQREYLDIVKELLSRKGIEINDEIEKKAIAWQMNYGGRTPRCASQFAAAYRNEE
ncbi:MAG: ATP-binding protein [Eubacteriales bacterium]|nr:ATP-binding protein [Eubacteriales bacterium]